MSKRNESPRSEITCVHVETQIAIALFFDFINNGVNVLNISTKDSLLIEFSDPENEGSVGLGLVEPGNGGTEKMIVDGLIRGEGENDVVLVGIGSDEVV
ncbi:hypothetical protein MtrunA17_Chr7g0276041 [Medicago truncatula]|uniref:Uncharacterized protein n=1 Tax=Medicago truncatula TaxID=3880 RepID=A0A396H8I0_MEDTR|nr:hypothetical protein MtrunA17_Chr7g0276041 [Medicago truncatula]